MNRLFRSPILIALMLLVFTPGISRAEAPSPVQNGNGMDNAAAATGKDLSSAPQLMKAPGLPASAKIQDLSDQLAPAKIDFQNKDSGSDQEKILKSWVVKNLVVGEENLELIAGMGTVMHFDRPITRVSTSDPETADVAIISTNEFLITTKRVGASTILVWDHTGKVYFYNLNTTPDPSSLKNTIKSLSPDGAVTAYTTKEGYVVTGKVDRAEVRNQINDAAKAFNKDSVTVVTIDKAKQILLETRFIEIDRGTALKFGIDWTLVTNHARVIFLPGSTGGNLIQDGGFLKEGIPAAGLPVLGGFQYTDKTMQLGAILKAMEDKNILKIIARPNILVRDGDEAEFLVGGQMPIPTVTANTQAVTYKDFGTKLKYKPFVLDSNEIRLELETEISDLDFANGIISSGFRIPSLTTRKATTIVELKPGQTLVIGGLLQQRKTSAESGTPYLRKIPWLGRLFESTDNEYKEVELMVIITPYIIDPDQDITDLKKTTISDPMHTALEMQNPPFEDNRGLAMEKALLKFENARNSQNTMEDRQIKRDKLWNKYVAKKQLKRDRDKNYYELVNQTLYDGKKIYEPEGLKDEPVSRATTDQTTKKEMAKTDQPSHASTTG